MDMGGVGNTKTISQIIEQTASKREERNTGEMGKDEFLNLLITQLRNQDPMNPVDDKEFIGQMAQFSALEQMQNLNTNFSSMRAFELIGKNVVAQFVDEATKEAKVVEGLVTNVKIASGNAFVLVNGVDVPADKIIDVYNHVESSDETESVKNDIAQYTGLIGFHTKGSTQNQNGSKLSIEGIVTEISRKDEHIYAAISESTVGVKDLSSLGEYETIEELEELLNSNVGQKISATAWSDDFTENVNVEGVLTGYSIDGLHDIKVKLNEIILPVETIEKVSW